MFLKSAPTCADGASHCRYYLPGDIALSLEVQDLLARIFRPDPKHRIGLASMRRHPWLHDGAPSVLSPAKEPAAADVAPLQSEEGIRDVIHRARQRRLQQQRRLSTTGVGALGSNQQPALDRTSHSFAVTANA